jgi:predicted metalloprotease
MRIEGRRRSSNFEDRGTGSGGSGGGIPIQALTSIVSLLGVKGTLIERKFTHGTSEQRKRWFRRGFESGDARQCDTFAVRSYGDL